RVGPQALHEIQATTVGRWWIEVKNRDEVLLRTWQDVEVAPPRQWLLGRAPLPSLAAFVQPTDPMVAELVGEAAARVAEGDARPPAVRALDALKALLEFLALNVEAASSNVVGPRTLVSSGRASPLELQLLYAACLEHAGMP